MKVKQKETESRTSKKTKKVLSILLKIVAAIILVIALFFAVVFIINLISSKFEEAQIESYGQLVQVDGETMNVLIEGEGEETIVLLPGYGTAAPALDFKPLIEELAPFYKVVVVEPFGYGLSDHTDKERTTENIVFEIHEALQSLDIDEYILMGHSIAGIYGLNYVNKYEDEVQAFVGIDTSVPTQGGMDEELPISTFHFLRKSGLGRLVINLGDDPYETLPFDEETKEQMRLITHKNLFNASNLNEMKHFSSNFKEAQSLAFPDELPLLLFIQADNSDVEGWIPLHEEQVENSLHGKTMLIDADHYLHHTKSKEMVDTMRVFLGETE
ncbi:MULTISPECIES: alpha/beta hydrolase [Shouchella]|uniref:Alpha/beta hydrolase n=1 Tax=Shouchella hunanensis TaxID=766894 RepID=A0ABY7WCU5_9BACI|nr:MULTISPECIES: alpha/beta hydrolase [Shouchella]WDF05680.1 alpha/beta hydrolase [Shouchella hunanensis]